MKKMTLQNQFRVIKKFDKHRRRHLLKNRIPRKWVHLITHIPQEGLFISMKFFPDVTWSCILHIRKN